MVARSRLIRLRFVQSMLRSIGQRRVRVFDRFDDSPRAVASRGVEFMKADDVACPYHVPEMGLSGGRGPNAYCQK
jgi:hypothetical protein